ncbi:MAG: T9SS type A sorting domain-containing protein [Bacteroidales bacterium]|nr:T9SS type A sorting domain-containing protein [Bacteroidales bacterium]
MKRIFTLIIGCLMAVLTYAQFLGGGSGTESDPYRIYTLEHWIEFANEFNNEESAYGDFSGIHLRLMNDISDTMSVVLRVSGKSFNGIIHGGGHSIILKQNDVDNEYHFISNLGIDGIVDSLNFTGRSDISFNLFGYNYGIIRHCTSNFDCSSFTPNDVWGGFATYNYGLIEYCKNYTEIPAGYFVGICGQNWGVVDHCINYADLTSKFNVECSGITDMNAGGGVIRNCINFGNMVSSSSIIGITRLNDFTMSSYYDSVNMHWVYDTLKSIVQNCINIGNITTEEEAQGDFFSFIVGENDGSIVQNCFNAGNSFGKYTSSISGEYCRPDIVAYNMRGAKTETCLNIGNTGDFVGMFDDDFICNKNYYDKQMCRSLSIGGEYVESIAGGRLTSQLVGDTPELRAMLGDGWSYAEGRYPIPLGFENDSIVLRAATPIFLHAESDDDYEHIDSVASHFTVSTANGASWSTVSHNVDISGENATLRYVGEETLKTRLNNLYEKRIHLNIVNVPVVAETSEMQDFDIFPNPVIDILNITSSETISEIEILNVMGQVVKHIEVNADNAVCNVEDLTSGVYVVKIHTASTTLSQRRFVKE